MATPPTIIPGDLALDVINQAQRVIDMDDRIAELEPNASPLVVLLKKLKRVQAISPQVQWLEHVLMPRYDVTSATALSSATAIPTTNSAFFRVGDVVRDTTTGEAMEVTGVSASGIGVNRGIGAVAAQAVGLNDELFIVANVNVEGASLRTIKTTKLTNMSNFCEIVRTPYGLTGSEAASKLYGGPDRTRLGAAAAIEHMRDWEHICFFGARKEDTVSATGAPKRFAGGLQEFLLTNVQGPVGVLTESVFQTFLRGAFRYGSERKILFASPLVVSAIEGFARNNIKTSGSDDHAETYGVQMSTYVSGQGIVDIVMERAWNDSTNYKGYAFLVDMDAVEWHYLRDTKLLENRQANDADKLEDEYLTEACPVIKNEQKHGLLKGVTG